MLTEICAYLRNWFDFNQPKFYGKFTVKDGTIVSHNDGDMGILEDQYIRVVGSVFCDGVWINGDLPEDETFDGAVWLMAVPSDLVQLAKEIDDWQGKYATADSPAMSPFSSESFGGYSYTKAQGYASTGGGMLTSWQAVYGMKLSRWKKI